jgi:hypothetical protein
MANAVPRACDLPYISRNVYCERLYDSPDALGIRDSRRLPRWVKSSGSRRNKIASGPHSGIADTLCSLRALKNDAQKTWWIAATLATPATKAKQIIRDHSRERCDSLRNYLKERAARGAAMPDCAHELHAYGHFCRSAQNYVLRQCAIGYDGISEAPQ